MHLDSIEVVMNTDHLPPVPPLKEHRDPITGEPGAHPVATGLGAAAMGTLGMVAAGAIAGPIGIVAAAIGGAVIGGYAGTAVGEVVEIEEAYWHECHMQRWFGKDRAA